jgi:hypothetical protein
MKREDAFKAFDWRDSRVKMLDQAAIKAGDAALRSALLINGGAAISVLALKEFFSVVRMVGYNDWVSLEMEDFTMSTEAGIRSSIDALQATISR